MVCAAMHPSYSTVTLADRAFRIVSISACMTVRATPSAVSVTPRGHIAGETADVPETVSNSSLAHRNRVTAEMIWLIQARDDIPAATATASPSTPTTRKVNPQLSVRPIIVCAIGWGGSAILFCVEDVGRRPLRSF